MCVYTHYYVLCRLFMAMPLLKAKYQKHNAKTHALCKTRNSTRYARSISSARASRSILALRAQPSRFALDSRASRSILGIHTLRSKFLLCVWVISIIVVIIVLRMFSTRPIKLLIYQKRTFVASSMCSKNLITIVATKVLRNFPTQSSQ